MSHFPIPCAASSTTRTRVPQLKVSAAAFLPSVCQRETVLQVTTPHVKLRKLYFFLVSTFRFVDAFLGQHTIARRATAHLAAPQYQPVKPVWWTGHGAAQQGPNERPPGRDPVGADALWVALGSVGQLGHPQTPRRQRKNNMSRLEK